MSEVHFLMPPDEAGLTFGHDGDTERTCLARIAGKYALVPSKLTVGTDWWPMSLCPVNCPSHAWSWHYQEWKPVYLGEDLVALLLRE